MAAHGRLTPCEVAAALARAHDKTNAHKGLSDVQRRSGHAALDTAARELAAVLFAPRFEGEAPATLGIRCFILDARGPADPQ